MTLSNGTPLYPRAAASALNTPLRGAYGEPSESLHRAIARRWHQLAACSVRLSSTNYGDLLLRV
jgi:hypothetical protein